MLHNGRRGPGDRVGQGHIKNVGLTFVVVGAILIQIEWYL